MQCLTLNNYSPSFPITKQDHITEAQARKRHEDGEFYALLFGPPEAPSHFMHVFEDRHRVDVTWLRRLPDGEVDGYGNNLARMRTVMTDIVSDSGRYEMFVAEWHERRPEDGAPVWGIRPSQAFYNDPGLAQLYVVARPDAPIQKDKTDYYALEMDIRSQWIGPYPTFDELVSGAYVAKLPAFTLPPQAAWLQRVPQTGRQTDPNEFPHGLLDG